MMSSLFGKIVTVTGAASGIGKATASILHARGASLALADISSEGLKAFASSLKSSKDQHVTYAKVDVSESEQVNKWIHGVVRDFGRLDASANIAGILGNSGPIQEMTDNAYEQILAVNAGGVFRCLRAQLNEMSTGGSIVNVASVAGLMGFPGLGAYVASKHAVVGLTKTAAKEVGHRNIRVNAVAPGTINTPMMSQHSSSAASDADSSRDDAIRAAIPLGRIAEPEEVARLIAWLLSDDASYVNATIVRVDGGLRG